MSPTCDFNRRNYCGRWVAEQSDDYVRTAREVVGSAQKTVADAVRSGRHRYSEEESLDKLAEHMLARDVPTERVRSQLERLKCFDIWYRQHAEDELGWPAPIDYEEPRQH